MHIICIGSTEQRKGPPPYPVISERRRTFRPKFQPELAAAATAVVVVVAATAAAAAAAENEDKDDDPAAVSVTKKVAHIVYLLSFTLHTITKPNICYK